MNYTDKVLIRASQIAYFQINYDAIKEVSQNCSLPSYTLLELYKVFNNI